MQNALLGTWSGAPSDFFYVVARCLSDPSRGGHAKNEWLVLGDISGSQTTATMLWQLANGRHAGTQIEAGINVDRSPKVARRIYIAQHKDNAGLLLRYLSMANAECDNIKSALSNYGAIIREDVPNVGHGPFPR